MGIVIRQTIKSSVFVYLGVLVGVVNRLYLYPKFMTPEQIGFVSVLFTIGMVLAQFGMMGSTTTFSRFFQYFKERQLSPVFYFLFVLVSTVGGILCTLVLFVWKDPLIRVFSKDTEMIYTYFYYIPLLVFLLIYNNVFTLFSHNSLRLTVPSIFNDFGIKFVTALGVFAYGMGWIDFPMFVAIFVSSYLLADLGILVYCIRLFKIRFSTSLRGITSAEYRNLRNYSFFIFVGGLSSSVTNYADTILLSSLEGLDAAGIYSIAFFMGAVIEVPKKAIISISTPIISKHWLDNNMNEIHKLYKQSGINQGIIGLFLLLLLWVNLDELFFFIPDTETYIQGKYVALFVGLAKVTDMFMGVNSEILRTSRHYYYDLTVTILFIFVSIASNLILIPMFKLDGAAVATLGSVLFYNIMRYAILKRLYGFSPFNAQSWRLVVLFAVLFALFYAAYYLMPPATTYVWAAGYVMAKSLFFGGTALAAIYYMKLSPDFNRTLTNVIARVKRMV